ALDRDRLERRAHDQGIAGFAELDGASEGSEALRLGRLHVGLLQPGAAFAGKDEHCAEPIAGARVEASALELGANGEHAAIGTQREIVAEKVASLRIGRLQPGVQLPALVGGAIYVDGSGSVPWPDAAAEIPWVGDREGAPVRTDGHLGAERLRLGAVGGFV